MVLEAEEAEDVASLKKARRKKLHYRPLEDVLADLPKGGGGCTELLSSARPKKEKAKEIAEKSVGE